MITTAVTYFAARNIQNGCRKRQWLTISLLFCLGLLIGFKYSVPPVGISFYTFQTLSYVLDVYRNQESAENNFGRYLLFVSFFPQLVNFGRYLLFVSFFPQLVAGPVERSGNLLPQLKKIQIFRKEDIEEGFWLIVRGFFKKIVVADQLAPYADRIFGAPTEVNGIAAVLGTIFFAIQIYCDFSGYTDIARGSARMLGIRLMENFQHPYRAGNIQEFWHRWHISLTKWFTDYVYIPLGGSARMLGIRLMENFQHPYRAGNIQEFWHRWHISLTKWFTDYVYIPLGGSARMLGIRLMENFQHPYRAGNIQEFWHRWHISLTKWFTDYVYIPLGGSKKGVFRQCINIGIVFGLSGFWHGGSWHYVVWGLLHGSFLVGYILYRKYIPIKKTGVFRKAVSWVFTMLLVCTAWIFFRSPDSGSALAMISRIISEPFTGGITAVCDSFQIMGGKEVLKISLVLLSFGLTEHIPDDIREKIKKPLHLVVSVIVIICMMTAIEFLWLISLVLLSFGLTEHIPDDIREKIKKPLHLVVSVIVIICMMTAIEFLWLADMAEGTGNTFIYFRF